MTGNCHVRICKGRGLRCPRLLGTHSTLLSKFKERLVLLADIDAILPTEPWLEGVPWGRSHIRREARVTDTADCTR
jgi:hypothetical protein